MAQVLKEECREKILKAAKEEFNKKGYKGASLRHIAQKAGMTVGNLYRYYSSKEDLNKAIVVGTLDKIEDTLQNLTQNNISIETHVFDTKLNKGQLLDALDAFSDKMVDIYDSASDEFEIVMLHGKLNEKFLNWFFNVAVTAMRLNCNPNKVTFSIEELANTYAFSMWSGVKHIIIKSKISSNDKKIMIKLFFRTFINMLESDFAKQISAI